MKSIQQFFSGKNKSIDIPAGEYEGPLRIEHACRVDGHGATLWTKSGTALVVEADGVVLENLRIEITENPEDTAAAVLRENTVTRNVEVYGQVDRAGKKAEWLLPRMLDFGTFAAERINEFHRMLVVDSSCNIDNNVHGLDVNPCKLVCGENDVAFKISSLMNDTILYGDIVLNGDDGINRRIFISGRAVSGAKETHEQRADSRKNFAGEQIGKLGQSGESPGMTNNANGKHVIKGQRLSLTNAKKLFVCFSGENIKADIDPYAFQLYGDGKTRQDKDVVFFGNVQSENDGVYIDRKEGEQGVGICLGNVPNDVENIVVSFAVYEDGGNKGHYFSEVRNPLAMLYVDDEKYAFPLTLGLEKVVNILEVYRHKGDWKVKFVGAGYRNGLRKLCEQYGIDVL